MQNKMHSENHGLFHSKDLNIFLIYLYKIKLSCKPKFVFCYNIPKPNLPFMRKSLSYLAALIVTSMLSLTALAQITSISGNVRNSATGEPVSAVSITVKGSGAGTFTDDNGNFKLNTTSKLPLTLVISSIGFELQEVTVSSASQFVQVDFKVGNLLGQ